MGRITLDFDPGQRYEVVNAYNAIEGVLKGYGYVTEIVTVPDDNATATTANAETPTEAPATPVEPAAPDAPAEQVAPDAATPAETPADQQPQ